MRKDIEDLGISIDSAFENRDAAALERCIVEGDGIDRHLSDLPDERMILYYYLGNAWSDLDIVRNHGKPVIWSYNRDEHINAIKFFRKSVAVQNASEATSVGVRIQALTNIANMFSASGRVVFAIESWKKALGMAADFGMAGCNLAQGLVHYANSMYDEVHSLLVLRHAHKLFRYYIGHPGIHEPAREAFRAFKTWIEKTVDSDYLSHGNSFKEFSLGRGNREKQYKTWVLRNALFLNPLNDIFSESAIAHDILHLPNMRVRNFHAPIFHGFFNQMKQEFMSARYLYYQYLEELPEHKVHFSDSGRALVDTLDYTQHGLRYETLKNSFRMLYSIFDKVAYFINEYFDLGVNRKTVNFRSVWFEGKALSPKLEPFMNNSLRGLYFLSKEFGDKDEDYLSSTDPDARDMSEMRNNIEHKYFKIHWFGIPGPEEELRYDAIAYSVVEDDLSQKVMRLLRSAREALIYLSLAVHSEEKKLATDGLAMPLHLGDYD